MPRMIQVFGVTTENLRLQTLQCRERIISFPQLPDILTASPLITGVSVFMFAMGVRVNVSSLFVVLNFAKYVKQYPNAAFAF